MTVPTHALVVGSPARIIGFVCDGGARPLKGEKDDEGVKAVCAKCNMMVRIPAEQWEPVSDVFKLKTG